MPLAVLLAALVAAAPQDGGSPDPRDGGAAGLPWGGAPDAGGDAGGAPDGGGDAGAARDPDAELIDHLEEIERLELLDHLDLFDDKESSPRARRGR